MAKKPGPKINLNPSSADRWTTCTASPKYIFDNWDRLPPSGSAFSEEGTTAHELAAALLQDREPNLNDSYACPVPPNAEMAWHAWNYMEYVQSLRKPFSILKVEEKLPLFYQSGRNAIVDAAVINGTELHVVDFKYGAGVVVSPIRSLQATIYARCLLTCENTPSHDEYPITIHIYQPRGRASESSPAHLWETTWGEVRLISDEIQDKAKTILIESLFDGQGSTVFAPSDKACQWCPAKGFCVARQGKLTDGIEPLTVIQTGEKYFPPAKAISLKQLAAIVEHGEAIKKWVNDVQAYALDYMKAGHSVPGAKLVLSRGGNRYWSNPSQAASLMLKSSVLREDEVFEKTVIGPAAAEKLIGKGKFSAELTNLIARPQGKPVIAREDDSRESAMIDASSEFAVLDGAENPEF